MNIKFVLLFASRLPLNVIKNWIFNKECPIFKAVIIVVVRVHLCHVLRVKKKLYFLHFARVLFIKSQYKSRALNKYIYALSFLEKRLAKCV